jgi:hypothetical protein
MIHFSAQVLRIPMLQAHIERALHELKIFVQIVFDFFFFFLILGFLKEKEKNTWRVMIGFFFFFFKS